MWLKPKMFPFCFTKILNQAFLHDSHIWIWGFFTFLVVDLAHSAFKFRKNNVQMHILCLSYFITTVPLILNSITGWLRKVFFAERFFGWIGSNRGLHQYQWQGCLCTPTSLDSKLYSGTKHTGQFLANQFFLSFEQQFECKERKICCSILSKVTQSRRVFSIWYIPPFWGWDKIENTIWD